eukprot:SAG31_NODE_9975_length_1202_cov_1.140526_1_plen_79_part_00
MNARSHVTDEIGVLPTGLFFNSALVHKTPANKSSQGRRAYTNMYGSSKAHFAKQLVSESIAEATPVYEWARIEAVPRL